MSQSKWVRVGSVRRFDEVEPDKAQALKVVEEAAEVLGAWQACANDCDSPLCQGCHNAKAGLCGTYISLVDECADVIQATLNLVAAMGVEDFRPYMKACERRNRGRGRITDGKAVDE